MAGTTTPNLPTLYLDATIPSREAEVSGADWAGGMNPAGGCNIGIGINTGDYDPKTSDWSGLDQSGLARDPQNTRAIGGEAAGPITADQDPDFNDTLGFVNGTTLEVAPDASATDGTVTVVNKTGKTVPIGSRLWGPQTVAGQGGIVIIIDATGESAESPARVGVDGMFITGQQITVDYTVDGGPVRTVVYDVLQPENARQAAVGLANEFTVDPDVQATQLDQPVNHVALWSSVGPLTVTRAVVT